MSLGRRVFPILATLGLFACMDSTVDGGRPLDDIVHEYLFLELSIGNIDANHVDAYFGPDDIRVLATDTALALNDIQPRVDALDAKLRNIPKSDSAWALRIPELRARLRAMQARIAINQQDFVSFDDESRALFDTVAPSFDALHFDAILEEIDALLPGDGPLSARVETFENQFVIPPERLAAVFEAAIAECRRRTLRHIDLTEGESFTVEYVSDKPWSAYNWYQGNSVSLIQVNTDLPVFIGRAVDLGCHEGYPGHHTYNVLLEQKLVIDKGWTEYSLYPLFSPQSVIAEGSGNYGVELAFPREQRLQYETDVLFPLAGLDASKVDLYYQFLDLKRHLNFAGNEAARGYLNGSWNREQAVDWLIKYTLQSKARAEQRTRFFDTYRSYVINYNHGMALVAGFVESDAANDEDRWKRFEKILSTPVLPSTLER